jgi:hypothetical protein
MKKFISSSITLFILLTILWSASSWYFGAKAENNLKSILLENTALFGERLFRADLIDYRKTWLGANAILRISSDITFLSEQVGEFDLKVVLLNGPVFIDKSGLSLGTSRWTLQIDENNLTADQLQSLQSIFPESIPIADVRLDFKQKAQYFAKFKSFLGESQITGVFDLESEDNRGVIKLTNFSLGVYPIRVSSESINISYQHQKALTAAYKPGTSSMQIPAFEISHELLLDPVTISVKANSDIAIENNYLNGFVKVKINNNSVQPIPIKEAQITLQFNGLSSDSFIQLTEAKAELDNLQQQIQWVLEEQGEVPEGQDQIWQLQDQIDKASKQLPQALMQRVFNGEKSQVKLEVSSNNNSGSSSLSGLIKSADRFSESDKLISFLQLESKVNLDDDLFKFLKSHSVVNKKQFSLVIKKNKLLMQ